MTKPKPARVVETPDLAVLELVLLVDVEVPGPAPDPDPEPGLASVGIRVSALL